MKLQSILFGVTAITLVSSPIANAEKPEEATCERGTVTGVVSLEEPFYGVSNATAVRYNAKGNWVGSVASKDLGFKVNDPIKVCGYNGSGHWFPSYVENERTNSILEGEGKVSGFEPALYLFE